MKELLQNLTREELQELGKKYIKDYSTKLNNNVLIKRLSSTTLDDEDKAWIEQANRNIEIDKSTKEEVKPISKEVVTPDITTRYIDENTGRPLTSVEIERKAQVKGEQEVRELVYKAKKEANKTVIALVNPLSQEDINLRKTCESFITGNSFFTISVVVPFNVYVEIPKAIAEVIREQVCPNIIELDSKTSSQIPNRPAALIQTKRKYNIQVWTKEKFKELNIGVL